MARLRYVSWSEYGELLNTLANVVASRKERFDMVIGIARGGLPVAMVVSDRLGVQVDFINVKSYTGIGKRSAPEIVSTITEDIRGKRVLVVDDIVDEGDTLRTVMDHLRSKGPQSIQSAAVFTKPWSKVAADFSVSIVESWVVFPYERGEVRRLRGGNPKS